MDLYILRAGETARATVEYLTLGKEQTMTDSGSSNEGKKARGALTRSTLVAMTGIIAFVVIAYLA